MSDQNTALMSSHDWERTAETNTVDCMLPMYAHIGIPLFALFGNAELKMFDNAENASVPRCAKCLGRAKNRSSQKRDSVHANYLKSIFFPLPSQSKMSSLHSLQHSSQSARCALHERLQPLIHLGVCHPLFSSKWLQARGLKGEHGRTYLGIPEDVFEHEQARCLSQEHSMQLDSGGQVIKEH